MHLFCNPTSGDEGFSFETYDEFETEIENYVDIEYSIDFIDGDREDAELFEAAYKEMPAILESFMEFCDSKRDEEKAAMYYLIEELNYSWNDALDKFDEVCLREGSLVNAAEEYFFDVFSVPKEIEMYIDIEKFARDCEINGDFHEFYFCGREYTVTNHSCL